MKKQRGFALINLIIAVTALIAIASYGGNFYKLTKCDFDAPLKCEVIHGLGVFPPLSIITVWFGHDND